MRQVGTFSVGAVLGASLRFIGKNFVPVTLLVIFLGVPRVVLVNQLEGEGFLAGFAEALIYGLCNGLLLALLSMAVFQSLSGKKLSLIDACRQSGPTLPWALLAVIAADVLVVIGTLLLILPGILCMVLFFVAVPVAAVEGVRPEKALSRSVELVNGHGWPVFGLIVLYFAAALGSFFLLDPLFEDDSMPDLILYWGPELIFDAIFAVAAGVSYYDLRYLKEDVHLHSMREVFE